MLLLLLAKKKKSYRKQTFKKTDACEMCWCEQLDLVVTQHKLLMAGNTGSELHVQGPRLVVIRGGGCELDCKFAIPISCHGGYVCDRQQDSRPIMNGRSDADGAA